jgi:hypothetical protein
VQADALEIEALAKRRLADEYDAAQERGEVARVSDGRRSSKAEDLKPTAADIGLSHKEIHEARQIRDAEKRDPGVVRRTVDAAVRAGKVSAKNLATRSACGAAVSFGHQPNARRLLRSHCRSRLPSFSRPRVERSKLRQDRHVIVREQEL